MVSKKLNILILGGSGMLGHHCYHELSKKYNVFRTFNKNKIKADRVFSLKIIPKNKNKTIKRLTEIIHDIQPDVIINTIGFISVEGCEDNLELANILNRDLLSNINQVLKKLKLEDCHLIQISSAGVYGNKDEPFKPWVESDMPKPLSNYTKTKLEGEGKALARGAKTTVIRTDFYGINPLSEKSLLWFIIKCVISKKKIEGWQNIYFSPVSAKKLSKIIERIIEKNIFGLFNIGCKNSCNKYNFANEVCHLLNKKDNVNKVHLFQDRPLRPNYSVVNSSKLNKLINLDFIWEDDLKDYMLSLPSLPNSEDS